jgi:hypothetical protein
MSSLGASVILDPRRKTGITISQRLFAISTISYRFLWFPILFIGLNLLDTGKSNIRR